MNTSSWNIYHFSHIFGSWTLSWGPHPVPFIGFVGLVAGLVDVSPQSARCKPIDICSLVTPLNELRWTNPLTNWAEPPGRFRKLVLLIQKKSGGYGVGSWQVSVWVGRHWPVLGCDAHVENDERQACHSGCRTTRMINQDDSSGNNKTWLRWDCWFEFDIFIWNDEVLNSNN